MREELTGIVEERSTIQIKNHRLGGEGLLGDIDRIFFQKVGLEKRMKRSSISYTPEWSNNSDRRRCLGIRISISHPCIDIRMR